MAEVRSVRLEIGVETLGGVEIAEAAGADRIELCTALCAGGLTPSAALIEQALERTSHTRVQVLIRPRPGDFRYSATEVALMRADIEQARRLGAAGVVFGVLDENNHVDVPANTALIEAAADMDITFHRAFDVCADPYRDFEQLLELGCTRLLTSGRQPSVIDGASLIGKLVTRAGGEIDVMACGGLRADNAAEILERTGVRDLHAAVRSPVPGSTVEGAAVTFAEPGAPQGFDHFETDAAAVAALCDAVFPPGC
ncbi:copper homeostasis protein CutC [Nocardia uniformis]|uniref:PF03932 family protein CutC n=1 Tax=Nocardia uniformis TaxID=53432 RepID=A0A849CC58_9NOCA|nr:copper homeostasis protein CutC [Nocardia uniformis]NNH75456.1 copper homeostasis protein CutC [Nocardia uniformis]